MNIIRKFIGFVAAVCFVMSLWSTNAFASSKMSYTASCDENISDAEVLSMEGPSVTFEGVLNKNNSGNYAGMLRDGLSSSTGTRTIGSCIIPTSEDEVYVSTNNLKCFFYNEDYWIKFGEIGGRVKV